MSEAKTKLAVLIGRFQPFHSAHLALLKQALGVAPQCVVVIGSAFQARTPKNPFSWSERAEMIRLALPEEDRERVRFLPVRDYYDEALWTQAVRDGVARLAAGAETTLVGHFKDATSSYLSAFPGWKLQAVDRLNSADGTYLRDAYFGGERSEMAVTLAALVDLAPRSTLAFMRSWSALPFFPSMVEEWRMLRDYKDAWAAAPYPPVLVTVDGLVLCDGHVLLIRRGKAPGRGLYAIPGGFLDQRETLYQAIVRELAEETNLKLLSGSMRDCLKAVVVFDHPDRSLRGRSITHTHFFDLGKRRRPEVQAGDDAEAVEWVPVEKLIEMEELFHDDHFSQLDHLLGLTKAAAPR